MTVKTEYHSKWSVTQNEAFFKIECLLNGMLLKIKCH